jgi:hypothetical protein
MSEEQTNCNNAVVSVELLEMLIEIACDYVNPEKYHGISRVSKLDAIKAIKEAGEILDANAKS